MFILQDLEVGIGLKQRSGSWVGDGDEVGGGNLRAFVHTVGFPAELARMQEHAGGF